jgi:trehalose 6-phosphate synthase
VTALEPLVEAHAGIWVAYGSGNADAAVVDNRGGLHVPPANPRYRLRYVRLEEHEHRGYYYGFANEGLWPLCHQVDVPTVFRLDDFRMYQSANAKFAAAAADEAAGPSPLVLVQDYHFALAPAMLRSRLPSSTIVSFWHIPWPRPRTFRTCPWAPELLQGLLGSDILGFQTDEDCMNFLGCVEAFVDAQVDRAQGRVWHRGRSVAVRAYPVGVDWPLRASAPPVAECRDQVFRDLGMPPRTRLGVGIDRLDYTKGLTEKMLAIERLLELQPELRGRFVFAQVAEPSRQTLPEYRSARARFLEVADRVNARFGADGCRPVRVLESHHEPAAVARLYRASDFCYVNSLHDGMNLVAKEFVAARTDERGVLVLSELAGAARQLRAALIVNPYRIDKAAAALWEALRMSDAEQATRMRLLRSNVATFSASWWAGRLVGDAIEVREAARNRVARPITAAS